jgi:ankyrin repeat protein
MSTGNEWSSLFDEFELGKKEKLLGKIKQSNFNKKNTDAILEACKRGFQEVVQLLIQKRANLNVQDADGYTSLMLACERRRVDMVNGHKLKWPNLENQLVKIL